MAKLGRPSKYSPELGARICERIAACTDPVKTICEAEDDFPDFVTVFRWLYKHPEFRNAYYAAQAARCELYALEALEIADDGSKDTTTRTTRSGEEYDAPDHEWIARSKLRVDTRLRLIGKFAPSRFGEASKIEMTGKDGAPLGSEITPAHATRLNAILKKAQAKRDADVSDLL